MEIDNYKIQLAISFCREVVEYFEGMPMLTEEEEAMIGSAERTIKELKNKEPAR